MQSLWDRLCVRQIPAFKKHPTLASLKQSPQNSFHICITSLRDNRKNPACMVPRGKGLFSSPPHQGCRVFGSERAPPWDFIVSSMHSGNNGFVLWVPWHPKLRSLLCSLCSTLAFAAVLPTVSSTLVSLLPFLLLTLASAPHILTANSRNASEQAMKIFDSKFIHFYVANHTIKKVKKTTYKMEESICKLCIW